MSHLVPLCKGGPLPPLKEDDFIEIDKRVFELAKEKFLK